MIEDYTVIKGKVDFIFSNKDSMSTLPSFLRQFSDNTDKMSIAELKSFLFKFYTITQDYDSIFNLNSFS